MVANPFLSLIVATRGRGREPLERLLTSLSLQAWCQFELIVVDQNDDDRLVELLDEDWPFPIMRIATPGAAGASRARNRGLCEARGHIVLFPDDDCWYPPHFLAHAVAQMQAHGADVLTGRAADASGRAINGRYEAQATRIHRDNVFTCGIEWVMMFKRQTIEMVGGFDAELGVGAATPWQSCEAQDILLRCLAVGARCVFDPTLYGHHAELDIEDPSMLGKGRAYARGLGFVLRRYRYPMTAVASWIGRPAVRAGLSLLKGRPSAYTYYRNVAIGRAEGWRRKVAVDRAA